MKKIFLLCIMVITGLVFTGCSEQAQNEVAAAVKKPIKAIEKEMNKDKKGYIEKKEDQDIFINEKYDFTFKIPREWKENYTFEPHGGSDEKSLLEYQVEFLDNKSEKMEDLYKNANEDFRIYVWNKEEWDKVKDSFTEEDKKAYGEVLGEKGEYVYTVVIFKSTKMNFENIKEAFTMEEK